MQAINIDAIKAKVMRKASEPTGLMVAPAVNGFNADLNNAALAYDVEKQPRR